MVRKMHTTEPTLESVQTKPKWLGHLILVIKLKGNEDRWVMTVLNCDPSGCLIFLFNSVISVICFMCRPTWSWVNTLFWRRTKMTSRAGSRRLALPTPSSKATVMVAWENGVTPFCEHQSSDCSVHIIFKHVCTFWLFVFQLSGTGILSLSLSVCHLRNCLWLYL